MSDENKKHSKLNLSYEGLSDVTQNALASLNLEGIYPTEETLADIKLLDEGKITEEEYTQRAIKRATS